MKKISFDFGGSFTDIIIFENNKLTKKIAYDKQTFRPKNIIEFLKNKKFDQKLTTGGNPENIPNYINNQKITKVNEIKAIGAGGLYLYEKNLNLQKKMKAIVISLGTGTCFVKAKKNNYEHIGGTAIGGGTLAGLGKAILNIQEVKKIEELALKGNLHKVDLNVEDIVGTGIGIIPGWAPASHFANVYRHQDIKSEDLAKGIFSLCSNVIGSTVVFMARTLKINQIILGGRMAKLKMIRQGIKKVAKNFEIDIIEVENPEIMTAVGAVIYSNIYDNSNI